MEEKIKISLPKETLDLLKKDCEDFKITKQNGTPNVNAFINLLIANYYEDFSAHEESLYEDIKYTLSAVPEYYRDKIFYDIVKLFAKNADYGDGKKDTTTFSFKPTKIAEKAITYIENVILKNESLSSFYRRMFVSYSQKTKTEREKIIYRENFELLQRALKKGVAVYIILQSGIVCNGLSIYSVSPAKDELFNYILAYGNKHNYTLRLASVRSVALLSEKAEIPDENCAMFKRQIACAAQYPIINTDYELIKVQLTEKGKRLFNKIYLYRPTPINVDGDIYTFDCSANQLLYYFERFGDNALILSPNRLGILMRDYYYNALEKYKSIYKD